LHLRQWETGSIELSKVCAAATADLGADPGRSKRPRQGLQDRLGCHVLRPREGQHPRKVNRRQLPCQLVERSPNFGDDLKFHGYAERRNIYESDSQPFAPNRTPHVNDDTEMCKLQLTQGPDFLSRKRLVGLCQTQADRGPWELFHWRNDYINLVPFPSPPHMSDGQE
jgi:hypothetical protein